MRSIKPVSDRVLGMSATEGTELGAHLAPYGTLGRAGAMAGTGLASVVRAIGAFAGFFAVTRNSASFRDRAGHFPSVNRCKWPELARVSHASYRVGGNLSIGVCARHALSTPASQMDPLPP